MLDSAKLGKYVDVFMCIVSETRCTITSIAKSLGHSGIGKRRATISKYLNDLYEYKISFKPNLYFKNLKNLEWKAYFCKIREYDKIGTTYETLKADKRITYALLFSGFCDFFLTSKDPSLNLKEYNLEIVQSSMLYSPIYTIPHGWKLSFENAAKNVLKYNFKKGNLPRKDEGILNLQRLDMKIFELMKDNARRPFSKSCSRNRCFFSNS